MAFSNETRAQSNFSWLRNNAYPGRGIVVGIDQTGNYLVQVYWIMGRSENSRNRVFKSDRMDLLYTEATNPAIVQDPSLIIYNAMRKKGQHYVVSNGDQTDTVVESDLDPSNLNVILATRMYEPDKPNFTQRITAVSSLREGSLSSLQISILRKSVFGDACERLTYEYVPQAGFGHCVTTYSGDGDPLPPFLGDPLVMPLRGGLQEVADEYWAGLNEINRVSLAVKFIAVDNGHSRIHIINKYGQVK